jgi:VanZ family protein
VSERGAKRSRLRGGPSSLARGLLAATVLAVLVATLTPAGDEKPRLVLCLVCRDAGSADVLVNLMLYAPLGAAITLCGWRSRWALIAPLLLSASIEVAQIWIPGRDPSLGDVTFNTLGAALGVLLVRSSSLWLAPRGRLRSALATSAAMGAIVVLSATGVLFEPAFPRTTYWAQWTPDLGHMARYGGHVVSASLGPLSVPDGRLDASAQVRELLAVRAPLVVRAVAGPRVPALASLVSIADERSRQIVLLGADRDDLVYRFRMRAATLGLDRPDLRATGTMRGIGPGDSLSLTVRPEGRGYCLVVNERAVCGLGFTLGRGWALLYYAKWFPPWLRLLLDEAWLAGLLLPLGFWIRGRGGAVALIAAVAVAFWIVPPATGLLATGGLEFVGAMAGFGVGAALRRLAARGIPGSEAEGPPRMVAAARE